MKKIATFSILALGLAGSILAADFKGFVMDQMCSGNPKMVGDAACAQKCVKGGSPVVLVTPDGKVYKIANQDKVMAQVGTNATLSGKLAGDTITVASVK